MKRSAAAVIPAAGTGQRMGGTPKALLPLAGAPMLRHTLRPFLADGRIEQVVVALGRPLADDPPAWLPALDARITIVAGGVERGDSVRLALAHIAAHIEVVLVHDAARPLVTQSIVERAIDAVGPGCGAIAAIPVSDTLHEVDADRTIVATPDRTRLWRAQTPQAFLRAELHAAYAKAVDDDFHATDDAAIFLRYGGRVQVIDGAPDNLKVTTPADLAVAEALLARRA